MEDITNFSEQLVKRDPQPIDVAKRAIIIIGTCALSAALIMGGLFFANFLFILWMLAAGAVFLGFKLYTKTFVEYEYIITGNELDIDKIVAQSKRERLITLKISKFSKLSPSEEFEIKADDDATVVLAYGEDCEDWCAEAEHDSIGKVRLCFSPNKRTLLTLNQYLPARVRLDLKEDGTEE